MHKPFPKKRQSSRRPHPHPGGRVSTVDFQAVNWGRAGGVQWPVRRPLARLHPGESPAPGRLAEGLQVPGADAQRVRHGRLGGRGSFRVCTKAAMARLRAGTITIWWTFIPIQVERNALNSRLDSASQKARRIRKEHSNGPLPQQVKVSKHNMSRLVGASP